MVTRAVPSVSVVGMVWTVKTGALAVGKQNRETEKASEEAELIPSTVVVVHSR
jgi:hypothetical protein